MPDATSAGVVPPPGLIATARRFVDENGLPSAAKTLSISRSSLASLLAGLRVRRGTVVLVAQGLGWPGTASNTTERDE